jgi:hypothetical protein
MISNTLCALCASVPSVLILEPAFYPALSNQLMVSVRRPVDEVTTTLL